jgi:hypothetical protein
MTETPTHAPSGSAELPRRRRFLVYGLYLLLLASAVLTLTGLPALEQAVREGRRARMTLMVAPALLGLFIALFAYYRYRRVQTGRYGAGKAFVQVGLMVIILTFLLPQSFERYRSAGLVASVDLGSHLTSPDPEERALAAELARFRPRSDALRHVPRLLVLLDDSAPEVRLQAHDTLVALADGQDPGGQGEGSRERWSAYWKSRGLDAR